MPELTSARFGPLMADTTTSQVSALGDIGLRLLRQLRDVARSSVARDPAAELGGGETILLVDDEPQVRGFVRRALEEYGYRVLETSAVDEALALGASYPGRI